jgi:glycine/D-amino acid oxidase-like deaminating enzyme
VLADERTDPAANGSEGPSQSVGGSLTADVCTFGGGFAGLWTALTLKADDPNLDVAVIEGDICGGGASGRNGGFVMSWWSKFSTLKKLFGREEATRLARASAGAVGAIGRFCDEHGIDAQYHHDGWLWTPTSAAQVGAWEATLAAVAESGESPKEGSSTPSRGHTDDHVERASDVTSPLS